MVKNVASLEELRKTADAFLGAISSLPLSENATVVGLSGDLGSGKTAFTKCIAAALGIGETITSPTFILEKIYIIPRGSILGDRFTKLIHIDAYRLHSADEMSALDWEALLLDEHNLIFLEWPEQVYEALPKNMIKLSFEYASEGIRNVSGELI